MPIFSGMSLANLRQAHPDLQRLFRAVVDEFDCMITCSYRNKEDQEKAFKDGFSKAHWLESPHNYKPSMAVDCVPYPTKWSDEKKLKELGGIVLIKAVDLGIDIEWGGKWKFKDLPHYELRDWRKMI